MHDRFNSAGSPAVASQHLIAKSLAEDAAATQDGVAPEAPGMDDQLDFGAHLSPNPSADEHSDSESGCFGVRNPGKLREAHANAAGF